MSKAKIDLIVFDDYTFENHKTGLTTEGWKNCLTWQSFIIKDKFVNFSFNGGIPVIFLTN